MRTRRAQRGHPCRSMRDIAVAVPGKDEEVEVAVEGHGLDAADADVRLHAGLPHDLARELGGGHRRLQPLHVVAIAP